MSTVRYAPSGGMNVRSDPASSSIEIKLKEGDLMYDIIGVPSVVASLNNISYVWIKVHYYCSETAPCTEGEGWVTTTHAKAVPSTDPSFSDTYFSNTILNQKERLTNARYVYRQLRQNGWSSNAALGVLGNMEVESYLNPGVFFERNPNADAYGLTQWNPKSKLLNWLQSQNLSDNINNQVARICYETTDDSLQWNRSRHSLNLTFAQFSVSTQPCTTLADCFLRCYEQPGNEDNLTAERQANASKWSTLIGMLGY